MKEDKTQNSQLWGTHKKFLGWLYIASLALRLVFFVCFTRHGDNAWICFDTAQYQNLALQIAAGKGITNIEDGLPQTYRLPGYSLFLAGCYSLFSHNIIATLPLQIIIVSLLPLLVFIISLLLFPGMPSLARLSGIVAAIHPGFILYAGMLGTESLFTLFLCLFFILLALGMMDSRRCYAAPQHERNRWRLPELVSGSIYFLSAGVALGIASLIRPVGHYIILATIIAMLITHRPFLKTLRNAALLLCGWLCIVTPWLIRNYLLAGALFFHTLPGLHFLQYTAANITVAYEGCSYLTARTTLLTIWDKNIADKEVQLNRPLNNYERCRLAEHQAVEIITHHPLLALKDACTQMLKTCFALYSAQVLLADTGKWPDYNSSTPLSAKIMRFLWPELNHRWLVIFVYGDIAMLFFLFFGLIGSCMRILYTRQVTILELYALMFIVLLVGTTLAYGCARLRFPAEPFIIPLACRIWLLLQPQCE